jgi:phage terminase large subunit GpA-like protein
VIDADFLSPEQRKATLDRIEAGWRECFKPPERITVAEWSERNISLSERDCAYPGPLRLSRAPYAREVINSFTDPNTETITLCWAAQTSKSSAIFYCLGYAIDQDPGPICFFLPTEQLAKSVVENRLDPMINDCPALVRHKPEKADKWKLLDKWFSRCTLVLSGANSPTQLSSRPVRYLFLDEVDKFPNAKTEAAAIDLAKERCNAFWNRKIIITSTPTVTTGNVWRSFLAGDQRYFQVPCPHCGFRQKLVFEQLKFFDEEKEAPPKDSEGRWILDKVRQSAYYQCVHCEGKILDRHKSEMLLKGEWIPEGQVGNHRSYHLSALYPTWSSFGSFAVKFLQTKDHPDSYRSFCNSWKADPWEEQGESATDDQILAHVSDYKEATCPETPSFVVITADVGKRELWYVVRAWCAQTETSYLLKYGQIPNFDGRPNWQGLTDISRSIFQCPTGDIRITHGFIDSGWGESTEAVYRFCRDNGWIPLKGQDSTRQEQPLKWGTVNGLSLMHIQTDGFKDSLQYKLTLPSGSLGSWNLHQRTERVYADHLTAEVSIQKANSYGVPKRYWKRVRGANHLLDCEVYQLAAAMALNIRTSAPSQNVLVTNPVKQAPSPQRPRITRPDGRPYLEIGRAH